MKTRRTALSRIELLVVIVIIVLVPSILIASLEAARELAKIPVCANQLRQIGLAISLYAGGYDDSLPWWGYTPTGGEEMHPHVVYRAGSPWIYPSGKLKAMRLACLYEAGLITDPKILYCPANKDPKYKYESYINPPPWGYLPQKFNFTQPNQWVRCGYTYFPTDPNDVDFKEDPDGILQRVAQKMAKLDSRIPYLADVVEHKDKLSHNIQDNPGVNALFKDGHVVYCDDRDVFDDPVWDVLTPPSTDPAWRMYYYTIFKLIGQSCGPTE
jgi:type II secretory pathway pseudopilin PulG